MPQMMPLLWVMNLIYTSLMLNFYIMMTHYLIHTKTSFLPSTLETNLNIKYLW